MTAIKERISVYFICFVLIKCLGYCAKTDDAFAKGHLKPLGAHQSPEGSVQELWLMPNASSFYHQYVAVSKPVLFKGAAKISKGFKLWTDGYLRQNFGDIIIKADYGKKENRERSADDMTLQEFLKIYNTTDRYLVDSLPKPLQKEFSLPKCILCGGFTERLQDSVLWFSSGGTKSFLHIDNIENINCLMSGHKEWFFVDKENTKKIEIDHGEGEYCGADVDKVDMLKYPSLQTIPWWSAHMESGDCMYIPYGWAHQVRSHSRNLAVNIWWAPMSYFNESDCIVKSNVDGVPLSNFEYTYGEQLRFLILSLLEKFDGRLTFETIHGRILHEHSGVHLVTNESFQILDQNKDGVLMKEEIELLPAELINIALQRTPPGEVNIRGMAQKKDPGILEIFSRFGKQEPHIEEILLRVHKNPEEVTAFLEKHGKDLHPEIKSYLLKSIQEIDNDLNHEEL